MVGKEKCDICEHIVGLGAKTSRLQNGRLSTILKAFGLVQRDTHPKPEVRSLRGDSQMRGFAWLSCKAHLPPRISTRPSVSTQGDA